MLSTIFKYLWLVPLAILYIIWTIKAVKALIRYVIDRKNHKDISFWSDHSYAALAIWIFIHMLLMFSASLTYFLAGK